MNRKDAKKKYGENLRRLRNEKGLSQEELAKALGYTNRSSINKIEIGRSNIPTDKIARTAEVLGVSPLELFEVDDDTKADIYVVAEAPRAGSDMPVITEVGVVDTLPSGSFHGGLDIRTNLWKVFSELSDKNQEQAMSYMQYLADLQKKDEEKKDDNS